MKTMNKFQGLLLGVLVLMFTGCKEEEPINVTPTVVTGDVSEVYRKGATISGTVQNPYGATIKECGILISDFESMAEAKEYRSEAPDASTFAVSTTSLTPGKTYYYSAYASSGASMVQGSVKNFTTPESNAPILSEMNVSGIDEKSVSLSVEILDNGGSELELAGFCWKEGYSGEPTALDNVQNIKPQGNTLMGTIPGLEPNKNYRVRAYAVSASGVGYSQTISITTSSAVIPFMGAVTVTDVTDFTVSVSAQIIDSGSSAPTKIGFCWSTETNQPTVSHFSVEVNDQLGNSTFSAIISELAPETSYYIRAFATNEQGTGYSESVQITTIPESTLIEGNEGNVHVEEAGGLNKFIDDSNKYNITKLKVSGYLNGDDIRLIREMAGRDIEGNETAGRLVDLDISEATIVAGGDYYYLEDGQYKCWTSDNIIGKYMFSATILNRILLPNNAVSLGNCAFYGCTSLANISIPDNVVTMGIHTFRECTALTDVKLGNSVTKIDEYDFLGCTSLVNINIPNSVTSIGDFAFSECASLEQIDIPNSVISIGGSAFQDTGLKSVIIPDNITSISDYVFNDCSALESVTIPIGVTSIGRMSFSSCPLSSIIIPENVTFIDGYAFYKCTSLSEVTCNAIEPPLFGDEGQVFDTSSSATLYVPSGTYSAYCSSDWAQYFEKIDDGESHGSYENGVATVEAGTLFTLIPESEKYTITKLKVAGPLNGDDIRFIREMAGRDVSGNKTNGCLVDLDISEAKIVEGGDAYYDAYYTENDVVGDNMFERTILSQVFLPNGVISIGAQAFYGCLSLASITIPDGVTEIGKEAFSACNLLTSITIPDGVTSIGYAAFSTCYSLTSINIPTGVTMINANVFLGCSALTNITIPEGVTYIGYSAFRECSSLTKVTCKATTPPELYGISVFSATGSNKELIVPAGCATAYSESMWWATFFENIIEM